MMDTFERKGLSTTAMHTTIKREFIYCCVCVLYKPIYLTGSCECRKRNK